MPWWRKKEPGRNATTDRRRAVREWAQNGNKEELAAALNESDPSVRREALFALGALKDARALRPLWELMYDDNSSTRDKAAEIIVSIPGINATQLFAVLLQYHYRGTTTRNSAFSQFIGRGPDAAKVILQAVTHVSGHDLVATLDIIENGALNNTEFGNHLVPHRDAIFPHSQQKATKPYRPPEECRFDKEIQRTAVRALAALADCRVAGQLIPSVGLQDRWWSKGDLDRIRLLSEKVGPPMVGPLIEYAVLDKYHSQFFVELLSQFLIRYSSHVSVEDLRQIAGLRPVKQVRSAGETNSPDYESWEEEVDCAGIKRIAHNELMRRPNSGASNG